MLYIKSFSNYTEFQEIFGVRVFGEEKLHLTQHQKHGGSQKRLHQEAP